MFKRMLYALLVLQALNPTASGQGFLKGLSKKVSSSGQDLIIRKATEKAEKAIDGTALEKNKKPTESEESSEEKSTSKKESKISSYSKFDFVAGQDPLLFDNFEQDVVGEFPLKWFTNGSGEVVTLDGQNGKWLQLNSGSILTPTVKLPDNFTAEFDLFLNLSTTTSSVLPGFQFEIFDRGEKAKRTNPNNYTLKNILFFKTTFHYDKAVVILDSRENGKQKLISDKVFLTGFQSNYGSVVHVALSIQKERLRLWYNATKVLDLPAAVASPANFNQMLFSGPKTKEGNPAFFIGNLRIAAGSTDMRAKLLETGHFVTNGILFDSNSDNIKPESYGLLKEIAAILNGSPETKIKIVGHTDSDGAADANLALSRKRAESVKKVLCEVYNVKTDALSLDGKGAAEPVASNSTQTGKAENRRVEFIRIQ